MLAMVVNDDAGGLNARGVPAFFASVLAPTEVLVYCSSGRSARRPTPG